MTGVLLKPAGPRPAGGRNSPLLVRCLAAGAMPGRKCRLIKEAKHRVSSLASGPSLGYLVPYERIELLGSDTTAKDIFSQAERPE